LRDERLRLGQRQKKEKIEREEKDGGVHVRGIKLITLMGGRVEMITALKVPRQCPLILLVKVGW
jgi:hypothetical protein